MNEENKPKNKETLLKIIQIKSRNRYVLPKEVREALDVESNDHVMYTVDQDQGVRMRKTDLSNLIK